MESGFALSAFLGALVGTLVAAAIVVPMLTRSIERRIGADARLAVPSAAAESSTASTDHFAEIAPELVTLARSATDSAIRREELHEWHQPDLFAESEDDITQTIRAKLRRATFNVAVAKSALQGAVRRHAAALPADLRAELTAFSATLDAEDGAAPYERKRRLAAELDAIEARIRAALGANAA